MPEWSLCFYPDGLERPRVSNLTIPILCRRYAGRLSLKCAFSPWWCKLFLAQTSVLSLPLLTRSDIHTCDQTFVHTVRKERLGIRCKLRLQIFVEHDRWRLLITAIFRRYRDQNYIDVLMEKLQISLLQKGRRKSFDSVSNENPCMAGRWSLLVLSEMAFAASEGRATRVCQGNGDKSG